LPIRLTDEGLRVYQRLVCADWTCIL